MKYILETDRLYLRELTVNDKEELSRVLSDSESMKYYPHPFSEMDVENWVNWNIESYGKHGYGLWAVILKNGGAPIGDCGITLQEIDNQKLPEIGYHILKNHNKRGYATEAANACKDYAFEKLDMNIVYCYMNVNNVPSQRVAEKMGMIFLRNFKKRINNIEIDEMLYCIKR